MSERFEHVYHVARSTRYAPGTPWVRVELADRVIAELSFNEHEEVLSRSEMLADPALAEALRRWESGSDPVHHAEETAVDEEGEIDRHLEEVEFQAVQRLQDEEGLSWAEAYQRITGSGSV